MSLSLRRSAARAVVPDQAEGKTFLLLAVPARLQNLGPLCICLSAPPSPPLPSMRGSASRQGGGVRGAGVAEPLALPREPLRLGTVEPFRKSIADQKSRSEAIRACCGVCGAADGGGVRLRACDACDAVRYCGRECQLMDWPCHRLACKILSIDREIMVGERIPGLSSSCEQEPQVFVVMRFFVSLKTPEREGRQK